MKNKNLLFFIFLIANVFAAESFFFNYRAANTNFTYDAKSLIDRNSYTYNYDRFRNDFDFGWDNKITFKIIFDIENFLGQSYLTSADKSLLDNALFDIPLDPYHEVTDEDNHLLRTYLYRAYSTIYLPKSSLTLGFQRIPLGVGKIWTPTDVVNPLNPLAIEKQERLGVYGANYIYDIGNLAQFKTFFTKNRYGDLKDYGYLFKTNYQSWDLGLSHIGNADQKLNGFDVEREIFETGLQGRIEYAWISDELLDQKYDKYILGFDYGFLNSAYLAMEYLKDKGDDYLGATLSYELTPLMIASGTTILNIDDGSLALSPLLQWSLQQDMDLSFGTSMFYGEKYSEYGELPSLFYVSLSNYF